MQAVKDRVVTRIELLKERLIDLSCQIQAHPELGYEEVKASAWLAEFLETQGFEVQRGVAGLPTAFVASLHGKSSGPTVAFLAEYDALPHVGHGCGHNLIGTGAVGAAAGVAAVMPELPGTLRVVGTPAEEFTEGLAGKIVLLEQGVFSGVDVCLMFHPWTETAVARSDFGFMIYDISFEGKAAHAAADPWNGLNALDAVVLTYSGISALRQQLIPEARIHCIITGGGEAVNVIPRLASMRTMFRSTDPRYLEVLAERIQDCIQAAALATRTQVQIRRVTRVQPSRFNRSLYQLLRGEMAACGGDLQLIDRWNASSDFGNVSQAFPALSMLIQTHEPGVNWHSEVVAERAITPQAHAGMLLAARVLGQSAVDLLVDPDLLDRIRADHAEGSALGTSLGSN